MMKRLMPALAALFLTLGVHAETPPDSGEALPEAVAAPPDKPKLAYGQMIQQGDKRLFSPCRDRSYLFLEDVSPDAAVIKALDGVGLAAGKPIYVELLAVAEGNNLKASALNQAVAGGRCQQPGGMDEDWRAAGNEPAWLLAVGREQLVVKRQGKADRILPVPLPGRAEGQVDYRHAGADGALNVRFTRGVCRDTMAAAVFGWRAELEIDGQTLRGCAGQR